MIPISVNSSRDAEILAGLQLGGPARRSFEELLYTSFFYLTREGERKYSLTTDDSASAYSDAVISVIDNVVAGRFEHRASLKTYISQIFYNKCVDLKRKSATNKERVHHTSDLDTMMMMLPDNARNAVQQLIDNNNRILLRQKLSEIGEKCKELLLLFEDGYPDREIATMLHYNSAEVVKVSRRRCLDKLREKMPGYE
ncbi:RNA polymerase sigma-70 factor, ECF subfamily [Chitinophaga jiangningensis]|uniref:RNA polymerase sigma-70 factor, ECF subfamily n=1 Tax=Chitinophaga jiangningensis TaxID=1419482 RepID=A0A1M7GAR9_9BACT|nr:sigma-70 family RNA polymerase sigma factor [Chitinophaga jiangningensis]SHM13482.1 RNA polymerase sigma-70 factor, ECF subfamily [Chitinophaga jiangningensis]